MASLGQMTILEAISALILLFTAFYFIFKPIAFKDNWQLGILATVGRDILISLDFTGKLYNASFSDSVLKAFLLNTSLSKESVIISIFPEETIKESILVAANCSQERIRRFSDWFGYIVMNRRSINIFFIPANLTNIPDYSDLLLICGYVNLTNYKTNILNYLSRGKGIVEISDFPSTIDQTTKEIFGIDISQPQQPTRDIVISVPSSVYDDTYYPYKLFYNLPLVINSTSRNETSGNYIGNFTFRNYTIPFEIDYSSKRVYFRTSPPISVSERSSFSIGGYKFMLSYILSNSSIAISFKKIYNFTNFRGNNNIYLLDGNLKRMFLYEAQSNIPVAILNRSKVAWIADFDRYNNATYDQRLALLSLILTVSSKSYLGESYSAYKISYLNVESYDVYEVYKAALRITYPSG